MTCTPWTPQGTSILSSLDKRNAIIRKNKETLGIGGGSSAKGLETGVSGDNLHLSATSDKVQAYY